jgi:antibiotic biosynthesis monooxygenase (ABM) superfamily enzyme
MENIQSGVQKQKEGPVTVSIARKIKPGFEKDYETWEKAIIKKAASFPGYMGTSFLKPNSATKHRYIIIYRFDSYENACAWEDSEIRKKWLEKVDPMLVEKPEHQKKTGLEVWFELPEIETSKPAPRYKMAIVLTVTLYILSVGINIILKPVLKDVPLPVNILIVLIINVILMTWVIMPKVTYWLRNWLYRS